MKKVLVVLLVILVLFPINGVAQSENTTQNKLKTSINQNYTGFDYYNFGDKYEINITVNRLGNLKYIEDYFTVDSNSNPKHVMSKTYYDSKVSENNISFEILRPVSHSGKTYKMIRGAIILNDKRIYERWLRISSGAHLTYTIGHEEGNSTARVNKNIAKFEIQDRSIRAGLPVVYKFRTPELSIYQINVTGDSNGNYIGLRVELLDGVSVYTKRFPWAVYKYLDVSLDSYQANKIIISYKVENSWINNSNISEKDIRLFRWNDTDKKWHGLNTKITNVDGNYTYYESNTTNLSPFVIAELRRPKPKVNKSSTNTINITDIFNTIPTPIYTTAISPTPTISQKLDTNFGKSNKKEISIMNEIKELLGKLVSHISGGRI